MRSNTSAKEIAVSNKVANMKTLAERLSWARTQKEWSQQQLADKSGVAQSTIGSLEAGTRLTARKITAIAAALEVNSLWLAEGKGPRDAATPYQVEPAPKPEPRRWLQWVSEDESELLSEYRACAKPEQDTSLVVLKSLPKIATPDRRTDKGQ